METQLKSNNSGAKNIDNGIKELIERSPGLGVRYEKKVNEYLFDKYGKTYSRNQLIRIVHNKTPLNLDNMIVKEAFQALYEKINQ